MRFISERFVTDGKMAKGALILSKSKLVFGTINDHWGKNFYHKLLYEGTPQDIEEVIDIVSRKERSSLTPFERWLASEPKSYDDPDGCRWCESGSKAHGNMKIWTIGVRIWIDW